MEKNRSLLPAREAGITLSMSYSIDRMHTVHMNDNMQHDALACGCAIYNIDISSLVLFLCCSSQIKNALFSQQYTENLEAFFKNLAQTLHSQMNHSMDPHDYVGSERLLSFRCIAVKTAHFLSGS